MGKTEFKCPSDDSWNWHEIDDMMVVSEHDHLKEFLVQSAEQCPHCGLKHSRTILAPSEDRVEGVLDSMTEYAESRRETAE